MCVGLAAIRVRVKSDAVVIYDDLEGGYQYPVSRKYEIDIKDVFKVGLNPAYIGYSLLFNIYHCIFSLWSEQNFKLDL